MEGHTSPVAWEDHPRPESQEEHQAHTRSTHGSEKSKSNRAAPCVQPQNDWRYQAHGHFAVVNQITRPSSDKDMCIVNFSKHLAIENEKGIHIQTVIRM